MEPFGAEQGIYKDVDVLDPEPDTYKPTELPEREDELSRIHSALRPITLGGSPRNILVYGPTGQGKTVGVDLKTKQLQQWADSESDVSLTVLRVSCKGAGKSWNVLANLVKKARETRYGKTVEKPRGPTKVELFEMLSEDLQAISGMIIIVLDEIDGIQEDSYVLYELPRASIDSVSIGVIGITNDYQFHENLDADIRSSLGSREVVFSPYDADQLRDILARRAAHALRDTYFEDDIKDSDHLQSDVLSGDVIPLCAALAGQDTGDARQAIHLLSTACDLALDDGSDTVSESHVRDAREEIQEETIGKGIRGETIQRKIALLTVLESELSGDAPEGTTQLYRRYKRFTKQIGVDTYQQGTFREKLNDLAHGNILESDRRGRGRGRGMTNMYSLSVDPDLVIDKVGDDNRLSQITERFE
ncbi:Cdc6/Cdc18 family protein [Natrinema gelatinilyticum]|uniref:Cdc6/Cdc18 family protein n=1 Tax=Natrinema gelatinilyticum TaxID=2961571 RepID=UPI0020C582BB|nr:AAA family ATPase [Natrinema gelatinilyticum]